MLGLIKLIFGLVLDLIRSRAALEAEVLVLLLATRLNKENLGTVTKTKFGNRI